MTASKTERIIAAMVSALAGTTGVGSRIYRDRQEAISRAECPALVIEPTSEEHTSSLLPYTDSTLLVDIHVLVNGSPTSTVADPVRASLHSRLYVDDSMGGLVRGIESVGCQWSLEPAEIGVLVCSYRLKFRTLIADLTQ